MTTPLSKGGNMPWGRPRADVQVTGLPAAASVLAFLVGPDGRVRGDDDFVFFNNPSVPGVTIVGHRASIDLATVPTDVDKVVVAAVQDDADPAPLSASSVTVTVGPDGPALPVTGLTSERAVVLAEVYRRAGEWKLRNVSAGWTEGFAALVRAHGVDVDDGEPAAGDPAAGPAPQPAPAAAPASAPAPASPASAPAPAINLRKPGVDAVDLGTRTGTINLRKGEQVTITRTPLIVATCTWPRATDYDIFALVRYRDGHTETVSTFGTAEHQHEFRAATADGAVRHGGDVGRAPTAGKPRGWRRKPSPAGPPGVGRESIEITLNPQIVAVVPVVYSAQSNGDGSFRRYQVSMSIDNGSAEHGGGDTVTIDATDASDDDAVYSCVPGIIINDPDGVRIQFLELYSRPASENRPVVGGDLIVKMDAGPVNAFK
ncbi:TerD family protein [Nakamurella sp.]|uniref:TerD family protein n=1 Tax=Nakamurella sp. TaxID=1869182 RepID=UPI0037848384